MVSPTTPASRLRSAIDNSPYSIRSLARTLAARDDVEASEDSVRRTLSKKLAGKEAVGDYWAAILEDQLELQAGTLREENYSQVITLATQLVRRLDAGETLPAETLLEIAEATEAAGRAANRFAARLRREARAPRSAGSR